MKQRKMEKGEIGKMGNGHRKMEKTKMENEKIKKFENGKMG